MSKDNEHMADAYLGYLEYVNAGIKRLITNIQQNTGNKAIIIVMGDHGFREHIDLNLHSNFQNMNAVYIPGGDYHLLYDSISGVNQFSVILNTVFGQSLAMQKDSTVFLKGKY